MTSSRTVLALAAAAAAVLLAGCGSGSTPATTTSAAPASAASASSASSPSGASSSAAPASGSAGGSGSAAAGGSTAAAPSEAALEQYCEQSGGQVQTRTPAWNTNGDQSQWLPLAGSATMCRFQADDEAMSRIYVDLDTLGSTEPTLAGLAYLSKVPMPSGTGGANPATLYCSKELNASSSFGGGASGGGWVAPSDPADVVVSLCVFPDGSFIDEWGLAYHSAGDVRGKDLTTVMKYQPAGTLPPVFPTS
ncbi:hypothetical protein [Nakamurella sp.]|uniref:hypothetical protein n=1 Tax=Nakamurella sp. TaxID=1869182 RepID=UPI003B3AB026